MKATRIIAVILLAYSSLAWAQTAAPATEHRTVSQVLDRAIANVESEFVPAAEALPEDKYAFAPSNGEFKGVRTFAQQVKHVAAVNYMVAAAIMGEKPPVETGGENGPDSVKTKADIIKFLKDSFVYARKAAAGIDEKNLVETVKSPFGEGRVTRLGVISAHERNHPPGQPRAVVRCLSERGSGVTRRHFPLSFGRDVFSSSRVPRLLRARRWKPAATRPRDDSSAGAGL